MRIGKVVKKKTSGLGIINPKEIKLSAWLNNTSCEERFLSLGPKK